jgi:capsid protein
MSPDAILKGTSYLGSNPVPQVTIEQLSGGGNLKYFRSNSGSKLEQLKNERPSVQLDAFMDRLIRNACVGAGWPFELTWDASKLGGANVRLLLAKAMRAVEDRQDLLRPVAKRCVGYAVAKAIKQGLLPGNPEWYAWEFTMPARMTADYGRDAKADLADYQAGLRSMTDILSEEGIDIKDHIKTLHEEREMLAAAGIAIGSPAAQPAAQPAEDDGAPEAENPEMPESEDAAMSKGATYKLEIPIHLPAPVVHLGKNEITVTPPNVTVQPPQVTVNVPEQKKGKRMFIRDETGKIVGLQAE